MDQKLGSAIRDGIVYTWNSHRYHDQQGAKKITQSFKILGRLRLSVFLTVAIFIVASCGGEQAQKDSVPKDISDLESSDSTLRDVSGNSELGFQNVSPDENTGRQGGVQVEGGNGQDDKEEMSTQDDKQGSGEGDDQQGSDQGAGAQNNEQGDGQQGPDEGDGQQGGEQPQGETTQTSEQIITMPGNNQFNIQTRILPGNPDRLELIGEKLEISTLAQQNVFKRLYRGIQFHVNRPENLLLFESASSFSSTDRTEKSTEAISISFDLGNGQVRGAGANEIRAKIYVPARMHTAGGGNRYYFLAPLDDWKTLSWNADKEGYGFSYQLSDVQEESNKYYRIWNQKHRVSKRSEWDEFHVDGYFYGQVSDPERSVLAGIFRFKAKPGSDNPLRSMSRYLWGSYVATCTRC